MASRKENLIVQSDRGEHAVTVELLPAEGAETRYRASSGDATFEIELRHLGDDMYSLLVDGVSWEAMLSWNGPSCDVSLLGGALGAPFRLRGAVFEESRMPPRATAARSAAGSGRLLAPMPGKVVAILKKPGERVSQGEGIIVMEAMKMENELTATVSGTMRDVQVCPGETVEAGTLLAVIEP
ncbi:MAG: biotin/lipoyl-binding protein [Candidatus Schekmanbacteria bacterium]|nr:biotin/lipoyl-binding protein [Candidatus Schekmanbacteria bacterium]